MTYYSNLIFLLVQLLLVQSNDPNHNDFYQKRLTMRNQRGVLHTSDQISVGERSPIVYSNTFFEQSYFQTQTTTPIATRYRIPDFNRNLIVENSRLQEIEKVHNRISEEYRRNQQEHCDYFPGNVS
jgi:hypothetical protein